MSIPFLVVDGPSVLPVPGWWDRAQDGVPYSGLLKICRCDQGCLTRNQPVFLFVFVSVLVFLLTKVAEYRGVSCDVAIAVRLLVLDRMTGPWRSRVPQR